MDKIKTVLNHLENEMFMYENKIEKFQFDEVGYFDWNKEVGGAIVSLKQGFGAEDSHYQISFDYPEKVNFTDENLQPCILVKTTDTDIWDTNNPQFIVSYNQKVIRALDINHHFFRLPVKAKGAIHLNVYTNTTRPNIFLEVWYGYQNVCAFELYYRLKALYESYQICQKDDIAVPVYLNLFQSILEIVATSNNPQTANLDCLKYIESWLVQQDLANKTDIREHVIGHTHIDLSWLWTLEQTEEKVIRSFSNALYLLNTYPEMTFMSSTPLLYEFLMKHDMEMFVEVKKHIHSGRWFIEGGMYVESDVNLPSGESLIRQIYYGKKYFAETFQQESRVLWLPDCFGFSASLPQIIKKAELEYFFTSKLDWNEINRMPQDTFLWQGIDGSEVLSYFLTTSDYSATQSTGTTYNGRLNASQVKGTWGRYQNKELSKDVLQIYGFGDGGGGPTEEMLEYSRVFNHQLPNMPKIEHSSPLVFFERLKNNLINKIVPVWQGELYLETHRGVYTTDGLLKKLNRQTENLLLIAEWMTVLGQMNTTRIEYPTVLEKAWKLVLINQFHDILPGTSIKKVHDEAVERYNIAKDICEQLISDNLKKLALERILEFSQGIPEELSVGNPTSFQLSEVISDNIYDYLISDIPAFGFKKYQVGKAKSFITHFKPHEINGSRAIKLFSKDNYQVETDFYRFKLNKNGHISDFYDKELQRIVSGTSGFNQFKLFNDLPKEYDAWNLDESSLTEELSLELENSQLESVSESAYKIEIRYSHTLRDSQIFQRIILYKHTKRIDFNTKIDWKEKHKCLKVTFDSSLNVPKATFDIQFGNIERSSYRNTSWDAAKFEVCAHKWADISEGAWGITLLNDCKYGYSVKENQISLTLLRSSQYPAKNIDRGIHEFTYSLYPHLEDAKQAGLYKEAYALNFPLIFGRELGNTPDLTNCLTIHISQENIVCESQKIAYEGDGYIIRCYEALGRSTWCKISIGHDIKSVRSVNLLENEDDECLHFSPELGEIHAEFKPYEIRTFKIFV